MGKITVTMDILDYDKMKCEIEFWKQQYKKVTNKKYIEIIKLEPEPGKENLEINFKAQKFIQNNIEYFGEEFEGFQNRINKVYLGR